MHLIFFCCSPCLSLSICQGRARRLSRRRSDTVPRDPGQRERALQVALQDHAVHGRRRRWVRSNSFCLCLFARRRHKRIQHYLNVNPALPQNQKPLFTAPLLPPHLQHNRLWLQPRQAARVPLAPAAHQGPHERPCPRGEFDAATFNTICSILVVLYALQM